MNDCFSQLPYETRNLGMPAYNLQEACIQAGDESMLLAGLTGLRAEHPRFFVQARIEKAQAHRIPLVSRCGFIYVETAVTPYSQLRNNRILQSFCTDRQQFLPGRYDLAEVAVTAVDPADQAMIDVIRSIAAESFVDDRFHLDPFCPPTVADHRYVCWVDDLLQSGATFTMLLVRGEPAGFMINRADYLVLAGFTRKYASGGLGDYLWLSVLENLQTAGHATAVTQIAVNNIAVLNLYVRLGFKFKAPVAIFHLWHGSSCNQPIGEP